MLSLMSLQPPLIQHPTSAVGFLVPPHSLCPGVFCLLLSILSHICPRRFSISLRCLLQCQLKEPSSQSEQNTICSLSMVDGKLLSFMPKPLLSPWSTFYSLKKNKSLSLFVPIKCLAHSNHSVNVVQAAPWENVAELSVLGILELSVTVFHIRAVTSLEFPPQPEFIMT